MRLHPEALEELETSALWYESKNSGLGVRFVDAVQQALSNIRDYPGIGQVRRHAGATRSPVRQHPVKGFPCSIYYIVLAGSLEVIAVAPDHRKPGYWQSRLP